MKLSIIIPVYNEEKTIAQVILKVHTVALPAVRKEIIVVNDGSTDGTASQILKIKHKISNVKYISHNRNQGKGAEIRSGITKATGEYILIQDADLEYNPQLYKRLLNHVTDKDCVIFGTRLKRLPDLKKSETSLLFFLHYCGNRFLSLMVSILYGRWLTDIETGYKLIPRGAIMSIPLQSNGFDIEPEITVKLLKKGYTIYEVPISTKPRGYAQGKKLHTLRDGTRAVWTIMKYKFKS
jgi:glycosyltransferase involved in cell wall biosynthesis